MDLYTKVARMLMVIVGSLTAGYLTRRSRRLPSARSTPITRSTMAYLQPIPLALMIWGLDPPGWQTSLLPFLAAALMLITWPVAWLVARLLRLDAPATGSFIVSAMFSNIGLTYGAFVCYILLGELGAALGLIYCLAFSPMLYSVGFFIGRHYGTEGGRGIGAVIRDTLREPQTRNPLLGLIVGAVLNLAHAPRPELMGTLLDLVIPGTTAVYLFAIGLSLSLTSVIRETRPCLALAVVKFAISPAIALGLAWLVGLGPGLARPVLQVFFIQSTTPVAIMALIVPQLFDLDLDLANAGWLTTNLAAIALAYSVLGIAAVL
jgi:malonate transporter